MSHVDFRTDPGRYKHWRMSVDGPVATLILDVDEQAGLQPGYEQKHYEPAAKRGRLCLVGSSDGRDGSVTIHQDISLYATILGPGERVEHRLGQERCAWIQVAAGTVELDGRPMAEGDGAAIVSQVALSLTGTGQGAEVLVFDLA